MLERGAGVEPLCGGSAPIPLIHKQFVSAIELD